MTKAERIADLIRKLEAHRASGAAAGRRVDLSGRAIDGKPAAGRRRITRARA